MIYDSEEKTIFKVITSVYSVVVLFLLFVLKSLNSTNQQVLIAIAIFILGLVIGCLGNILIFGKFKDVKSTE